MRRKAKGVSISAVNGRRQVVVGGREEDIEELKEELRREGIESVRLKVRRRSTVG